MKYIILSIVFISAAYMSSCGGSGQNPRELIIDDLPFHRVNSTKAYSDLILKAIRTNRDKPILQEFELSGIEVDPERLNQLVGMYSSAIGGRDDWNFFDFAVLGQKPESQLGFNYAWLDQSDRLGIQIYIEVEEEEAGFRLRLIELRSRLDVLESMAFPGGQIEDYKKIDYDWSN